ncbi:hypothetical protein [Micromonospora sp. C41]|uniref:hypothetical protein n=1 Tax=Micromonospora sp. C41 TaxID=2824878 RepID=UPI001B377CE7|nr:hypothetical protein [Micromonospora sp. C41]MBQ1064496.1 hypothetical protein [Micromonospora sp. C41]
MGRWEQLTDRQQTAVLANLRGWLQLGDDPDLSAAVHMLTDPLATHPDPADPGYCGNELHGADSGPCPGCGWDSHPIPATPAPDCDESEAEHAGDSTCDRYRPFDPDNDPWDGWGYLEGDDE